MTMGIPEDMSVAGFDDITISAYLLPPLTTLHQFKYDLGVGAARMMVEILESGPRQTGKPAVHKEVSLQGQLVIRKSTAPP